MPQWDTGRFLNDYYERILWQGGITWAYLYKTATVSVISLCVQKGFSALHIAAKYGNAEMVRLLLERNVDVNTLGKHHLTPLHVAAHYKHPNVAALLLDNHADAHHVAKVSNMHAAIIVSS